MERLTYDFCIGNTHCWQVKGADNSLCKDVCIEQGDNGCDECPIKKAFDRLAAYEDTGLEPETVCDLLERFNSLYAIFDDLDLVDRVHFQAFLERVRRWYQAEKNGRLVVLPCKVGDIVWRVIDDCTFPGDCGTKRKCKSCTYRNVFVEEDSFCLSLMGNDGNLKRGYFLTREEAEAALKKREADNETD